MNLITINLLRASYIYRFQPRMRGWFPRRCAVEAVDHYDSCQVFGILHFVILLLSFSNMLTHFRLERERIAVKKQINSPKRKAERQRKRNEEEMKTLYSLLSHEFPINSHFLLLLVIFLSFILISYCMLQAY